MSGTIDGGRQAQARGEDFESWLEQQHEKAVIERLLAWHRHVSPKIRFVGRGPRARPIVVGKATADYVGQTVKGQSIVVEAKSRKGEVFRKNEVEPQQQRHLDACVKNGGIGLLVLEFRKLVVRTIADLPKRYAIPWDKIPWTIRRTAEGVDEEDLKGWEVSDCYLTRFITL